MREVLISGLESGLCERVFNKLRTSSGLHSTPRLNECSHSASAGSTEQGLDKVSSVTCPQA